MFFLSVGFFKGDRVQGATICDCVWEVVATTKEGSY